MTLDAFFAFAQSVAPYVATALAVWNDRRVKAGNVRIKDLEAREGEHLAKIARLEAKDTEREATINHMRTETYESRTTNGKLDPAKDNDAKRAVQVCLDTLRRAWAPRGDEKRGGGA